jgi:thiol:disulfide interchange protein
MLRFTVLALVIISVAACAPAASPTPTSSAETNVVGSEGGLYPPQDLSLVSSTGRPQFINSYADWCVTCQHNHPIVNDLIAKFSDKIDFVHLNIDIPETLTERTRFDIIERSQYIFTDAQGNIVQKWFGILDQATIETYIQEYLAAANA